MLQFSYVYDRLLSLGINRHDSQDSIGEGYSEDILNGDIDASSINVRKGYERFAGDIPLRVEQMTIYNNGSNDYGVFLLPSYVDLSDVTAGPLQVIGKYVESGTVKSLNKAVSTYTLGDRVSLPASMTGSVTVAAADHTIGYAYSLIGFYDRDPTTGDQNIFPNFYSLNTGTRLLTIDYSTLADLSVTIFSYDPAISTYYYSAAPETITGTTITIAASTHGLSNTLIPIVYEETSASVNQQIFPQNISIAGSGGTVGDVTISFATGDLPSGDVRVALIEATNYVQGSTDGSSTSTNVQVVSATSRYLFAACYSEDPSTGDLTYVLPDSVVYNAATETHTITFSHPDEQFNYVIAYVYGETTSNQIRINGLGALVSGNTIYTDVYMAIYGVSQDELPVKTITNYIDNYLADDVTVIAADGLFYKNDSTVGFTESFDGQGRVASTTVIGPVFSSATPAVDRRRTQGYIVTTSSTTAGYVPVKSITYVPASGYTKYTLTVTGYAATPALTTAIFAGRDWLRIAEETQSRFNGEFEIVSVTPVDSNTIDILVDNPDVTSDIFNVAQSGAIAGIFTDELTMSAAFSCAAGNTLVVSNTLTLTVTEPKTSTRVFVTNALSTTRVIAGTRLGATYTTDEPAFVSSSLLAGDSVTIAGVTNRIACVEATKLCLRNPITVASAQCDIVVPYRWSLIYPEDTQVGNEFISRTSIQRSVAAKNSLYLAGGVKYDGAKIYRPGLPPLQTQLFIQVQDGSGIAFDTDPAEVKDLTSSPIVQFTASNKFALGDTLVRRVLKSADSTITVDSSIIYTVTTLNADDKITLDPTPAAATGVGYVDYFCKFTEYDYFIRLSHTDRNGNIAVSPSAGAGDLRIRLAAPSKVYIRGTIIAPGIENLDTTYVSIEVFRRNNSKATLYPNTSWVFFYKVGTIAASNLVSPYYFDFVDTVSDGMLTRADLDQIPDPNVGGIGESRCRALVAEHITSINNQLVYSNLTGENKLKLGIYGNEATEAAFLDKEFVVTTSAGAKTFKVVDEKQVITACTSTPGASFAVTVASNFTVGGTDISAGNWVYIANTSKTTCSATTNILGWWQVTSLDAGTKKTITINWTGAPSIAAADWANCSIYYNVDGKIPLAELIANYNINPTIRNTPLVCDMFPYHFASAVTRILASQGVYGRGGRDFERGFVELFGAALVSATAPATLPVGITMFGNGDKIAGGATVTAAATLYPSRAILSVPGYPEIFQSAETLSKDQPPLVIDVNPDDGEDLNGSIPFFSSASFGAAQQGSILVMFKNHSIYYLDPQALYKAQPDFFKKLATRGIGCEAIGSITNSKDGVFFANKSGIHFLDKSNEVQYIGHKIEHLWKDYDNSDTALSRMVASNYTRNRQYRLSLPTVDSVAYTDGVLSFKYGEDNANEYGGAWSRYDNIYATGYANRKNVTYFSTDQGYVGYLLDTGSYEDFHDQGSPIDLELIFRAMDFGLPSVRKVLKFITIYVSTTFDTDIGDVDAYFARDLSKDFVFLDTCVVKGAEAAELTSLGDPVRDKVTRIAFSPDRAHMTWGQFKLVVSCYKNDFQVNKVIYRVAALRQRGENQSSQTR